MRAWGKYQIRQVCEKDVFSPLKIKIENSFFSKLPQENQETATLTQGTDNLFNLSSRIYPPWLPWVATGAAFRNIYSVVNKDGKRMLADPQSTLQPCRTSQLEV